MWREFDISTRSTKMEDLGIEDDQDGKCSINLYDVAAFYETSSDKDEIMTNVVLRGGNEIGIFFKYSEFKKLINNANS